MTTVVTLVEIWNCRNLRTVPLTQRPYMIAFTIEARLSSMRIMSEASLVTSVPAIPIKNPTLASLEGGAIVRTITGDTNDFTERAEGSTKILLPLGEDQAKTSRRGTTSRRSCGSRARKTGPTTGGVDVALSGNRASSEDAVSGTHLDGCTHVVETGDSFADTRMKEVFDTGDGHQSHVVGRS